jgi:hypothetical protein
MIIFGLDVRDFIAILALCVAGGSSAFTAFAFLKTYSRNRKSEQIKIAREIMDNLNIQTKNLYEFPKKNDYGTSTDAHAKYVEGFLSTLNYLRSPLRYFAYLVAQKEIDDISILNYYRNAVLIILDQVERVCRYIEEKGKSRTAMGDTLGDSLPKDLPSDIAEIRGEVSLNRKIWESK